MKPLEYLTSYSKARSAIVLLIVFFIISLVRDIMILCRTPVPVGVDGFYYILQVDELFKHGRLYFSSNTPLALYAILFVKYVSGNTVFAVKFCSILFHLTLCLVVLLFVKFLTQSGWLGLIGCIIVQCSALHLYMVVEFIGQSFALTLLVCGLWIGAEALQRENWLLLFGSALSVTAALFSHRSILGLCLLIAGLSVFSALIFHIKRFRPRCSVIFGLFIAFCWGGALWLASYHPFDLPGQMSSAILSIPRWPLHRRDLADGLMLALAATSCIVFASRRAERVNSQISLIVFIVIAQISLLILLNPSLKHSFYLDETVDRVSVQAYVASGILVPGAIWQFGRSFLQRKFIAVVALIPFLILGLTAPLPRGATKDYLTRREVLVASISGTRGEMCDRPIAIAPHGDEFAITSILGVPAQQSRPLLDVYGCKYWLIEYVPDEHGPMNEHALGRSSLGSKGVRGPMLIEEEWLKSYLKSIHGKVEYNALLTSNYRLRELLFDSE